MSNDNQSKGREEIHTIYSISSRAENGERITVNYAMELLGLNKPGVDTALPQSWVLACINRGWESPVGQVVWSYREEHGSPNFGAPVPLTVLGGWLIRKMKVIR